MFEQAGLGYFYLVFIPTFGRNQLGMGQTDILIGLVLAQLSCAAFIPLFGMLSDRVDRRAPRTATVRARAPIASGSSVPE